MSIISRKSNKFQANIPHSRLLDDVIDFFPPVLLEIISGYSLPYLPLNLQKSISNHIRKTYTLPFIRDNIRDSISLVCNGRYLLIEQYKKLYGPREVVNHTEDDYTECDQSDCDNWIYGGLYSTCDDHK